MLRFDAYSLPCAPSSIFRHYWLASFQLQRRSVCAAMMIIGAYELCLACSHKKFRKVNYEPEIIAERRLPAKMQFSSVATILDYFRPRHFRSERCILIRLFIVVYFELRYFAWYERRRGKPNIFELTLSWASQLMYFHMPHLRAKNALIASLTFRPLQAAASASTQRCMSLISRNASRIYIEIIGRAGTMRTTAPGSR